MVAVFFLPIYANAVSVDGALGGVAGFATTFSQTVVRSVGVLFITMAVVAFLWGMVQFIWAKSNGGDGGKIKVGQDFMGWGLLALFIMFSVWGIIEFVGGATGINTGGEINMPYIQLTPGLLNTTNGSNQVSGNNQVKAQTQNTSASNSKVDTPPQNVVSNVVSGFIKD